MSSSQRPKLLVTGAGGQLGAGVVLHLAAAGVRNVVAASRQPDRLRVPLDYEKRRVDFDDPASLEQAFAGIDKALIISTDRIDEPGLRIRQHCAAVDAAREAGVKHLLYTSMLNPESSLIPFAADHLETERAIEATGLDFTILRVSWYADNLPPTISGALSRGHWHTSASEGRINYVSRNDVARAAAAALATRTNVRERLDIVGNSPLSIAQIADIVERLGACPLPVVQVSEADHAEYARTAEVPEGAAALMLASDANMRAGLFDVAGMAIETLTGSPATSLEAFLAARKVMWQP